MRQIRPSILRWPGGWFADGYHWQDGVGAVDGRPARTNLAWGGEESNRFGTDEFIDYCRRLGCEPYLCVNVGSGTPEEAAAWVEYCNGTGATAYAGKRRANGSQSPFGVKYWGIGNEIDETDHVNEIGCLSAVDYARAVREYSKLMKRVSPDVETIAVGSNSGEVDWNLTVLEKAGAHMDTIALHGYYGTDDYYSTVAAPVYVERRLRMLQAAIELASFAASLPRPIGIAFDEWNVWYRTREELDHRYEEQYELKDALFAAGTFNVLHRMSSVVKMANLAQMVNALGMVHVEPDGMVLTPLYTGSTVFDTFVISDTFDAHDKGGARGLGPVSGVPYIDASATLREDNRKTLCLAVVNRHRDEPIECAIELSGFRVGDTAGVYELAGASVSARNSLEDPGAVGVAARKPVRVGETFVHRFPPHSATVLELPLQR